jgi:hypothetical protein
VGMGRILFREQGPCTLVLDFHARVSEYLQENCPFYSGKCATRTCLETLADFLEVH